MGDKPTYPTPNESTPTADLLDMIDDTLRNGCAMTRANLCFSLLCERLGFDRDEFPTFKSWYEAEEKREMHEAEVERVRERVTRRTLGRPRACHPDCVIGPYADHAGTMSYRCMDDDGNPLPFDAFDTMED